MSKVIILSRYFPDYHPKKGQPTHFVEKFYKSIDPDKEFNIYNRTDLSFIDASVLDKCGPKSHTIRAGQRFKVGDTFSPRIWSGKPYRSTQIVLVSDVTIEKIWKFEIKNHSFYVNDRQYDGEMESHYELLDEIAFNDGLTRHELTQWFKFPTPFDGQIICWNKEVNYL